jgi:hypothetical protein
LGNLFEAKLTLVFGNSLKIDGLKFDLLEENFPISHFPKSKIDHYPRVPGSSISLIFAVLRQKMEE